MLDQTLLNLRQQQAFSNREVVVLIAPALTKERFDREYTWKNYFWHKPNKYDFVSQHWANNWSDYENFVALPALTYLLDLEQHTNTRVIPNIVYKEFCQIMMSNSYKAIFLVAHHICQPDFDAIEFADGAVSINDMKNFFLQQEETAEKVSLLLFVCQVADLKNDIYLVSPLIQSVAAATWNIPLHGGIRFIYHWCKCLDGTRTLSDAYHQAIEDFTKI